jgi:hypothetical protein
MIPARILRDFTSEFSIIFTRLFLTSLNDGKTPTNGRKASIVPIYKKADKHKASKYRTVSLNSISSKLLERFIHSNIIVHYDILADQQHGFRSDHARPSSSSQFRSLHAAYHSDNKSSSSCLILLTLSTKCHVHDYSTSYITTE